MTWLTEFSVLTGIPVACYGRFANQVIRWAPGNIYHSLPATLNHVGYTSWMVYPSSKNFINSDKYYASLGFKEIFDAPFFGSKIDMEPDYVYHDRLIATLRDRIRTGHAGPQFGYVLTSSNHFPHECELIEVSDPRAVRYTAPAYRDNRYLRAVLPEGEGERHEYLRRLSKTASDYAAFKTRLAEEFPNERFLIVHFGDHQPPFIFKDLRGTKWDGKPSEVYPAIPAAYETYFALDGVNFKPAISGDWPSEIEAAYLGVFILEAAGAPIDNVNKLRRALMIEHDGKLFDAKENGLLARQLNFRLLEAGLLQSH